jgi:hypothetical protein
MKRVMRKKELLQVPPEQARWLPELRVMCDYNGIVLLCGKKKTSG